MRLSGTDGLSKIFIRTPLKMLLRALLQVKLDWPTLPLVAPAPLPSRLFNCLVNQTTTVSKTIQIVLRISGSYKKFPTFQTPIQTTKNLSYKTSLLGTTILAQGEALVAPKRTEIVGRPNPGKFQRRKIQLRANHFKVYLVYIRPQT